MQFRGRICNDLSDGNIKGQTRVITTSIALQNSMGDYSMAIALGILLFIIAIAINSIIYTYKKKEVTYSLEITLQNIKKSYGLCLVLDIDNLYV